MSRRAGMSETVGKTSKSSIPKTSCGRNMHFNKVNSRKTNCSNLLSGSFDTIASERGKWDSINPLIPEDFSFHKTHKLTGSDKHGSGSIVLTQTTNGSALKTYGKHRTCHNALSFDCPGEKSKQINYLGLREMDKEDSFESPKDEIIQQLNDELFECQSTMRLLNSNADVTVEKLQNEISLLKDDLTKEIALRSTIENSQTALVKLTKEMESLLEAEHEKVCNLTSNCTNLKQDCNHWETLFKQEQLFRQELEQKFQELLGKDKFDESFQNLLRDKNILLTETEKLHLQYTSLIKQLDGMNVVADEHQLAQEMLEKENRQLSSTIEHLNKLLSEHAEKPLCGESSDVSDVRQFKDRLKEAIQDGHLHQQRCNQLHHQIDGLRQELQDQENAMTEKESLLNQELGRLQKNISEKEMENEKLIRDKNLIIEKLELSMGSLTKEKSNLMAQLHETELDLEGKRSNCRKLEQENQILSGSIDDLRVQQKCQEYFEQLLNELTEQRTKLSYENGLLTCRIEKLQEELERMPALLAELHLLRRNATTTDAKNLKLQAELAASRTLIQELESELNVLKASCERLQKDRDSVAKAKDLATADRQKVTNEIQEIRREHLKTVEGLQKSVAVSKQDNVNLSAMLETVIKSHTSLQATVEAIQAEQAKKDSLIEELTEKNKEQRTIREQLEADLAAVETRLITCRDFENAEVAPLKRDMARAKEENKKLVMTLEALLKSNEKHKTENEHLQNEVSKISCNLDNLKEESTAKDNEHSKLKSCLEEKIECLKCQLLQERECANKKAAEDKQEMKTQIDQFKKGNNELGDLNSQLRSKNKELEYRIKEEKQKSEALLKERENFDELRAKHAETEANLQILRDQVVEMERTNNEYLRSNNEQAVTIEKFMSVVFELQNEVRALGHLNASLVDSNRQLEEQNKVQKVHEPRASNQREADHAEIWNEIKKLVYEAKSSRDLELEVRRKSKRDKRKASESVQRAAALMEASRKTIAYLTDVAENSHCEVDLEVKTLREQLDNERSRAKMLEHKLIQVQESSLRHTEQLARELDVVKSSSTRSLFADKCDSFR